MRLAFVTRNEGKVRELAEACKGLGIEVVQDKRGYPEMQAATLAEVAAAGADHLLSGGLAPPFLLEDSGLFVSALNGFPGVYSRHALDTIGCAGLLRLAQDLEREMRGATFRTHLLYVDAARERHAFEGTCKGRIADRPEGTGGFGFDPIFVPDGSDRTFAQMGTAEKNAVSHRGRAVRAFLEHLAKTAKR
jgi:XTP/dITP diphosphohydrolase